MVTSGKKHETNANTYSLRKQPTFREATAGFPTKWCLSSLRSKRFCAVYEQRTRNESQRPREKCASKRAGRGWGLKEGNVSFLPLPLPLPLFHFLALVSFLARSKPKIPFLDLLCYETKRKRLLCRLMFEKQVQKFRTDDVSLPR